MSKTAKRGLALLVTLVMCICLLPATLISAETDTATYTMSSYKVEGQLGGAEATRDLDDVVKFTISSGWFTSEARIYKNANGVLASTKPISTLVLNAGYKNSTFDVYTSEDGETWNMYQEDVAFTTSYADVTLTFDTPVKYIKLDSPNAQLRIKTITATFAAEEVAPQETTATIDFSTTDNRVSQDTEKQIWAQNGITLTNNKHESTSDIRDYSNPVRIYAKTSVTIEYAGLNKLVVTCPTQNYANALKDGVTASYADAVISTE